MKKYRTALLSLLWFTLVAPLAFGMGKLSVPSGQEPEKARLEQNRELWKKLSPEEKERIVRNYKRWKSMTHEKRNLLRKRFSQFQALSKEKQLGLIAKVKLTMPNESFKATQEGMLVRSENEKGQKTIRSVKGESPTKQVGRLERGRDKINRELPNEKAFRPERVVRPERLERAIKPERIDQPMRIERLGSPLKPEHIEPPPKPEKLELPIDLPVRP